MSLQVPKDEKKDIHHQISDNESENFQKVWNKRPTGLTVVEAAMAITSTSLGSGIVSIPYGLTHAGF